MNKANLIFRHAPLHKFLFHIIIHIKSTVSFRCGKVAEYKLRQAFLLVLLPSVEDIFHAGVDFTALKIRYYLPHHMLVKSQLSAIVGNLQHVVNA